MKNYIVKGNLLVPLIFFSQHLEPKALLFDKKLVQRIDTFCYIQYLDSRGWV